MITWYSGSFLPHLKSEGCLYGQGNSYKGANAGRGSQGSGGRGMWMAEYRQMSIYFDMEKPDEAWVYQYLMSLRHGKKAIIITALKMMLGKGEQAFSFSTQAMQPPGNSEIGKAHV